MSPSQLMVGVVLVCLVAGTAVLAVVMRRTEGRGRALLTFGVVISAMVTLFVLAFVVADLMSGSHGYDRPYPVFPLLATEPDPSLHGTVAFISDPGDPTVEKTAGGQVLTKNSCARVVPAAGGIARDVQCWPMPPKELASVAWRADGRLRVTVFDPPDGDGQPIPVWGRIIDLSTGGIEVVADADLAADAMPPPGAIEAPNGDQLMVSGHDGSLKIDLIGESGRRRLLSVSDANPGFGLISGPEWAADSRWFTFYDGRRLLTTTTDEPAVTRVLAAGVSGAISQYGASSFAMTDREW